MTPITFSHQKFLEQNKEMIAEHPLPDLLQKRILGFEELQEDMQYTTDEDRAKLMRKLEILSDELDEDLEEYFEPFLENNDEEEDEPEVVPEQTEAIQNEDHVSEEAAEELNGSIEEQQPTDLETDIEHESDTETIINSEKTEIDMNTENTPEAPDQEQRTEFTQEEVNEKEEHNRESQLEEPAPTEERQVEQQSPAEEELLVEEEPPVEDQKSPDPVPDEQPVLERSDEDVLRELMDVGQTVIHSLELRKKGFKGVLGYRSIQVGRYSLQKGKYDTCYKILENK